MKETYVTTNTLGIAGHNNCLCVDERRGRSVDDRSPSQYGLGSRTTVCHIGCNLPYRASTRRFSLVEVSLYENGGGSVHHFAAFINRRYFLRISPYGCFYRMEIAMIRESVKTS